MRAPAFAVLLFATVSAGAEEAPPPTPPVPAAPAPTPDASSVPPAALEQLDVFAGRWLCEGEVPESPLGPAHATRTTMTVQRDLGGFWVSGRAVQSRTESNPAPMTRMFFWTYDPVLGKYAGGWLDSRGGWSTQTSVADAGWKDGEFEWYGHINTTGQKSSLREILTMPRDGEFTRRLLLLDFDKWVDVGRETCREAERPRPEPAR